MHPPDPDQLLPIPERDEDVPAFIEWYARYVRAYWLTHEPPAPSEPVLPPRG